MVSILFEHTIRSYLPEVSAYRSYLADKPGFVTMDTMEDPQSNPDTFDVVWKFVGVDLATHQNCVVHEYNSLSTGRLAQLKNTIKRKLNSRPDMRVFLNQTVKREFSFRDGIPCATRDMGVAEAFYATRAQHEYDLVYAGSITADRGVAAALESICDRLTDLRLLVVGDVPVDVRERYSRKGNIDFIGRVPYSDVPEQMARARAGLNIIPDRYPFNLQASTKLLEYCALNMNIVSTRYGWVEQFSNARNAEFLWVKPDLSDLTAKRLNEFQFITPDVSDLEWNRVIDASGVFESLGDVLQ